MINYLPDQGIIVDVLLVRTKHNTNLFLGRSSYQGPGNRSWLTGKDAYFYISALDNVLMMQNVINCPVTPYRSSSLLLERNTAIH